MDPHDVPCHSGKILNSLSLRHGNPHPVKLIYSIFHPIKVVPRYRDLQLQVGENYSYLFNLRYIFCKFWCLNTLFLPNINDLINKYNRFKMTIVLISRIRVKHVILNGDLNNIQSISGLLVNILILIVDYERACV